MGEIEETSTANNAIESAPLTPSRVSSPHKKNLSVRTKVPEVEVHLYRRGNGPIDVFISSLGGWDQNQLEVNGILDKYGFKSLYAFNPGTGRGRQIRYARNGRSVSTYTNGSVVYVDGEPKDSSIQYITKLLVGVAVIAVLILLAMKDTPEWAKKLNISGGRIPPWVLACVVIVFTRLRRRSWDFLDKRR
nr:Fluoroacetate dehalogenase [Ipomoea batatas]